MCKTTTRLGRLVFDSLAASAGEFQVPGLIHQLAFGVRAAFRPAGLLQQDVAGHSTAAPLRPEFACPQDQHQLVQVGDQQPFALLSQQGTICWCLPASAQAGAFRYLP